MPNITILRGDYIVRREDISNEAITPGHLLSFNANDKIQKHASSGGNAIPMFAIESDYLGNDTTTAHTSGDKIPYAVCPAGTVVWAHLASGQTVARGEYLESNGDGQLKAYGTGYPVCIADEDKTSTANGTRFRAEVI
jgi:hypothetical protein